MYSKCEETYMTTTMSHLVQSVYFPVHIAGCRDNGTVKPASLCVVFISSALIIRIARP